MRLRLSPFVTMRDPRESMAWQFGGGWYGDHPAPEEASELLYDASTLRGRFQREFRMVCLTMDVPTAGAPKRPGPILLNDEFERGYARSRLWELYAERSRGVCIVLRKETAMEEIRRKLADFQTNDDGPVHYRDETLSHALQVDLNREQAGDTEVTAEYFLTQHFSTLFRTKNTECESEREYRFIVRCPEDADDVFVPIRQSLAVVLAGPAAHPDAGDALRRLSSDVEAFAVGRVSWWNNDPTIL
jgi:Protein of unknown function (DUF2971)